MELLAVAATLLVAVGGWVAAGILSRRATRRTTRVEYLLSAYRRLDAAIGRQMDPQRERDLESAIADIQLLGTARQVSLADDFARSFASDRSAEAGDLLEDLRRTLRDELLLERAPDRKVWLRIDHRGDLWAREVSRVQARLHQARSDQGVLHSVAALHDGVATPDDEADRIARKHEELVADLASHLSSDLAGTPPEALVRHARKAGIVSSQTAEALEGLTIMKNLAMMGRREVSEADVAEYETLVDGVLFAIRRESAARSGNP